MNNEDDIKALVPVVCPHCNNTLVVEFLIAANLLSKEDAEKILAQAQPPKPDEPKKGEEDEEA